MKDLFETLRAEGEAVLERLRDISVSEGVQLEFKEKQTVHHGAFEKTDKRNLARTLSAFANSAGGLLVFGARARTVDGVDSLQSLHPIAEIARFTSEAVSLCGQLLLPRHEGIEVHAVRSASNQDHGYLAIWVERSARRPHQSKAPDDGQYYKRAGDSTFPMEHYDIEDAFRRVVSPELSLETLLLSDAPRAIGQVKRCRVSVEFRLTNEGALARHPFLLVERLERCIIEEYGVDGNMRTGLPRRLLPGKALYAGGVDDVLHPGIPTPITRLRIEVEGSQKQLRIEGMAPEEFHAAARLSYGCADHPTRALDFALTGQEIVAHLHEARHFHEFAT
jgi:hypothetical protein